MSCRRQARARVEKESVDAYEGNCCWRITTAGIGQS